MGKDYDRFFELIQNGFHLNKMHIKVSRINEFNKVVNLEFKRNGEVMVFSSSDEDLFNYIIHLHPIPHIEDDDSDFMYIEDTIKYFDIQKKVMGILSGKLEEVVICSNVLDVDIEICKLIKKYERMWIDSEKNINVLGTKLSQIFYDLCVIKVKNASVTCYILDKNIFKIRDLDDLIATSQDYDASIAISAFILTKRHPFKTRDKSDAIIGIVEYDLKNQKILSLNVKSIMQLQRTLKTIGHYGLWECVEKIFSRTEKIECFDSLLPLPLNVKDYTCLPWICFGILGKLGHISFKKCKKFDIPLILVFGIPPLFLKKPGYIFNQEKQKALIMLGIRDEESINFHQMRFDLSKGEPNLHVHYEIVSQTGVEKVVNHQVINYNDVLSFNENLAIGLLIASAYDVYFDIYVLPNRFDGIIDVFRDNPVMIYPLYVRSMAGQPCRMLLNNEELYASFLQLAEHGTPQITKTHIDMLEKIGVIKEGKLTILGDIVRARLIQMREL